MRDTERKSTRRRDIVQVQLVAKVKDISQEYSLCLSRTQYLGFSFSFVPWFCHRFFFATLFGFLCRSESERWRNGCTEWVVCKGLVRCLGLEERMNLLFVCVL